MGNQCSGGLLRGRRRDDGESYIEIAFAANRPGIFCSDLLPVEAWRRIIIQLGGNHKDLLRCRMVCHTFKNVADEELQRLPGWTTLFPYISSLPLIFIGGYGETVIRRTIGTRFPTARSLREFLKQMKGYTGNPFPFRSVLLYPNPDLCIPSRRPHHQLYKKFPKLTERFGDEIWSLELCVREDVSESIKALKSLYEMKNLRRVTIYTTDWNKKNVRQGLLKIKKERDVIIQNKKKELENQPELASWDENEKRGVLDHLQHLQIMGSNGILPLNHLFAPFGCQITSLYFCFMDDASSLNHLNRNGEPRQPLALDASVKEGLMYSIPSLCPNLVQLKIYEVNEELMDRVFPFRGPNGIGPTFKYLKELSIKLQRPFIRPLNRLCLALDEHCAETLKMLHLEISRWPPHEEQSNSDEEQDVNALREPSLDIDTTVKLESLQDLTISYSLFLQEPDFLFMFAQKCPNLKNISFVSVNIHAASFPDFEGFCKPLWKKLPKKLKEISVSYWICEELNPGCSTSRMNHNNIPGETYHHFCSSTHRPSFLRSNPLRCFQPDPVPRLQRCARPDPNEE